MPQVAGQCEDTGQFKQKEHEINEGNIGYGVTTNGCNASELAEVFLKGFNGVGGGPQGCDAGLISFKLSSSDGAIGSVQMGEHVGHGDVSKSKGVVVKSNQVEAIDGSE